MIKEAFEKWLADGGMTDQGVMGELMRKAFEAGWNAARAEPRSDAAEATGGRRITLTEDQAREVLRDNTATFTPEQSATLKG